MTAAHPEASQQAVVETALVLLERMGLTPADLAAVPQPRQPVPTFAEYVPVVSAVVWAASCSTARSGVPRRTGSCCGTPTGVRSPTAAMTTCGPGSAGTCPGWPPRASAPTGYATFLTWVERNFGYAVARAYAGHTDSGSKAGATSTYVRASLAEVAAALAAPRPRCGPAGSASRRRPVRPGLPAARHLALAAPGHRHHPAGRRRGLRCLCPAPGSTARSATRPADSMLS